jgi:alpha,alpha-trehalase
VVNDRVEVAVNDPERMTYTALPSALDRFREIAGRLEHKRLALFLDYDGTLTPIVERPELAVLSAAMRATVRKLAGLCTVAVISGRDLRDVQRLVGLEELFYAGSHGFDIQGPASQRVENQQDPGFLPLLDAAEQTLRERLAPIPGSLVERKRFSITVHYRRVDEPQIPAVETVVDDLMAAQPKLKKTYGKKMFELQPNIDWHKGKAVHWLLQALALDRPDVLPVFIGDDITDEDAFQALREAGIGIVVSEDERPSAAHYRLHDPAEVERFFARLLALLEGKAQ